MARFFPIKKEDFDNLFPDHQVSPTPSSSFKIVSWSDGTDAEIAAMVAAADSGKIDLTEYWNVGDERKVHLSAMNTDELGESHVAQDITFVLMDTNVRTLTQTNKPCSFVVGQKNCLLETGKLRNQTIYPYYGTSYDSTERRNWCNNIFYNALPKQLKGIFKQFQNETISSHTGNATITTNDYFTVFALGELDGGGHDLNISPLSYYKGASRMDYMRKKTLGDNGKACDYWTRSPLGASSDRRGDYYSYISYTGDNTGTGSTYYYDASNKLKGISVYGCI